MDLNRRQEDSKSVTKRTKVDMSAEAVTARLKRCCRLGESELLLMRALSLSAELHSTKPVTKVEPSIKKTQK